MTPASNGGTVPSSVAVEGGQVGTDQSGSAEVAPSAASYRGKKNEGLFQIAYTILGMGIGAMLAVLIVTGSPQKAIQRDYGASLKPITNKSSGADVQRAFAEGKEYSQFSATAVQMRDGTCYAYTNEVSWLAMECFGSVKR